VAKNPQARKGKEDEAQSRPLTIPFLQTLGALDVLKPPAGAFDPVGTWRHTYRLWLVQPWSSGGALALSRKPLPDGKIALTADLRLAERGGFERRTHATLTCAADRLATPLSWTLESHGLDLEDKPITRADVTEKGTLADGELAVAFGGQTRKQSVPSPATSNWSLFDAVQRLPREKTQPLSFTLIEDMDLVKPNQRLTFRETTTVALGGKTVRLHGYQQTGQGILPWQYWVDDAGRLLLAFSGVRAYILDPTATTWMEKQLASARFAIRRRRKSQ